MWRPAGEFTGNTFISTLVSEDNLSPELKKKILLTEDVYGYSHWLEDSTEATKQKWSCFQETGGRVKSGLLPSPCPPTPLLLPLLPAAWRTTGESQGFMRARCLSLVMAPLKLFFGDAKCIPNIKMLFVAFDFYFV